MKSAAAALTCACWPRDVEDWMIKNGKVIYGGYTTRQALADMPKEQVAKYGLTFKD